MADMLMIAEAGVPSFVITSAVEDRDAKVQSGMERGVREGVERLAELPARLTAEG